MCGIFGIINRDGSPVDRDGAIRALDILSHRGPDGRGYYHEGNVFLGHARLSIIDVEGGTQPIYNEDHSILVIANGEIYNHREIRSWLEEKGHRFATRSDSEVLVHLYEEEGTDFVGRLNGMFAFAIHDTRDGTVFLARDRVGIKPLYYSENGPRFIFSSEMKAIAGSGLVPVSINDGVVYQFLTLHYSIPPQTLFEGIVSLMPGHHLKAGRDGIELTQYWDIRPNEGGEVLSDEEAFERTESLLSDSVEKRLMSDVPLGLFLSGGIDSSLIAALMHRIVGPGIKTFSIGFREKDYSELPYSKRVSEMISSEHTEIIMTPAEIMENIESVIWYRETPISEMADIPVFLLSRAASEKVKVVLTGEGGDEVFGGYSKYVFERKAARAVAMGLPLLRPVMRSGAAETIMPQRWLTAFELFSEPDRFRRYYRWFSYFRHEELEEMLLPEKRGILDGANLYAGVMGGRRFRSNLDEMQYLDVKVWLPDNLLLRGDRMSMSAGLEARVPFLDHRLVELSYTLPERLKVRGSTGKYIIKKIAEKYLDRDIIYRRKVGFSVPVTRWLREDLRELMTESILRPGSFSREYFTSGALERMVGDHLSGKRDNHKKLWILLNFELWRDRFIRRG
jgi:asparagine synthase (glutamine-hydrolysing)